MYDKIPFVLMNVGATFQRAMDISFVANIDKFIVIYIDDMVVFSKNDDDHLSHLRKNFKKCRRFGLSLNSEEGC